MSKNKGQSRMRILIIDVNFDYKNPMYRQFYNHLAYCMEVDYFGPGYVKREVLEKGIIQFLDEREPYNAIFLGTYFVYSANLPGMRFNAYQIHRRSIPYYHVNDAYQCCKTIFEELRIINSVIKIFIYYEDSVSMPKGDYNICKMLLEDGFYLMSWPKQYMQIFKKKQMRETAILNNNAYQLAEEHVAQYVPIPLHAITYPEIFIRDYEFRECDWCIPGNRSKAFYGNRSEVASFIEKSGNKVWTKDPFQKLSVDNIQKEHMEWYEFNSRFEKFLSRIIGKDMYIPSYPKLVYVAGCRENYLESMRRSRYVYVDGGAGEIFVRKYFEACACGALMVGKMIPGLSDFGFKDGINCRIVEEINEEIVKEIILDKIKNIQIAQEGQKLILKKHMMHHRAAALYHTIGAIQYGAYKGAFWQDGKYIIKS